MSPKRQKVQAKICLRSKVARKCTEFSHTLETLPPEVLEMILRFLPYQVITSTVRLISRRCYTVATAVLNNAFLSAGARLKAAMMHLETSMLLVDNDNDLLACSKAFNVLELVQSQYEMLRAVTWRYTHPPRSDKFPRLCFYGSSILDDLDSLLRTAWKKPSDLFGPRGPGNGVASFISLCKRFMNYFEKVSERKLNRSALVSGCKTVDVLDCLAEGRQVLAFRVSPGRGTRGETVNMKLRYVMKRAWFTCLEVPSPDDENSWRDEQRFMYLRLRRLVGSVNEHLFEKLHYERELSLQGSPKPPPASTYSGYGEYGGQFFYYGNMNQYAYANKFQLIDTADWRDPEGEDTTDMVHSGPCYDLVVIVELRCSPELAPLAVRTMLKSDDLENATETERPELYLKLSVTCPASLANRLPGKFIWELRGPRHCRYTS